MEPKQIIKLIDESWDNRNLEYKKEVAPPINSKKDNKVLFKLVVVKLRDEKEPRNFFLSETEYEEFRKLQADYLGIKGSEIK